MMAEERTYELFISYAEADRELGRGLSFWMHSKKQKYATLPNQPLLVGVCPASQNLNVPFNKAIATLLVISEAYLADYLTQDLQIF